MHLGAEHTARFVRQALDAGTYVVCHQTFAYAYPDFGPAICRAFRRPRRPITRAAPAAHL